MRTIKLVKINDEFALLVPNSIAKLYSFQVGQEFNLEVNEKSNEHKLVFLIYAAKSN